MPEGLCRLCNKFGSLTFEHVPPKVTFNKRTRYQSIDILDYIKEKNPLNAKLKGKVEQGGLGYYSLCGQCNNFLGRTYVPDFEKYSNSFIDFAKKKEFNCFELTMHNFSALNVLKQIVSMFFSINNVAFSSNYRDLAEFVLDPTSNNIPKSYRIFNYLNTEGQFRSLPFSVLANLHSTGSVQGSEIAFPPLGHVLTFDFYGQLPFHQEITSFKDYGFNQLATIDLKIFRLPTYLPIFLDYRDRLTIEKTIEENS